MAAGLGKATFGGGSVAGDGGCHRRTVEVRGSGAKRAVARARRWWRRWGWREKSWQPDGVREEEDAQDLVRFWLGAGSRIYTQSHL